MSQDVYELDRKRHGGPHIDRYNRQGHLVGRYRPDASPIKTLGVVPPPVPIADQEKFAAALAGHKSR